MSRKNKLIGTLFVLGVVIQNYLAQISHVPTAEIEKWSLHDWVGSLLFVIMAGLTAWKAFITNPNEAGVAGSEQRVAGSRAQSPEPAPAAVVAAATPASEKPSA